MSARPSLKLILMSATISTDKFAAYIDKSLPALDMSGESKPNKKPGSGKPPMRVTNNFSMESLQGILPQSSNTQASSHMNAHVTQLENEVAVESDESNNSNTRAPVLFIPGYTFPVTEYYKNDYEQYVSKYIDSVLKLDNNSGGTGGDEDDIDDYDSGKSYYQKLARQQQSRKGELNYLLLAQLAVYLAISSNTTSSEPSGMLRAASGCILIFMPGVQEISRLSQLISTMYKDVTAALPSKVQ